MRWRRGRTNFTIPGVLTAGTATTMSTVNLGAGQLQFVHLGNEDYTGRDDEIGYWEVTYQLPGGGTKTYAEYAEDETDARDKTVMDFHREYPNAPEQNYADVKFIQWVPRSGGPRLGHVSEDPTVVSHCVFCGSGAIVARGDGGVECTLCNRTFSVMEQPLYSNMPSASPGANIKATPFDPLQQEDAFDPGQQPPSIPAPGAAGQGQPHGPAGGTAMPSAGPPHGPAGGQPGSRAKVPSPAGGKPPLSNAVSRDAVLRARNGTALDEEEFVLHHAIRIARGE